MLVKKYHVTRSVFQLCVGWCTSSCIKNRAEILCCIIRVTASQDLHILISEQSNFYQDIEGAVDVIIS